MNREASWLAFNKRVLEEAENSRIPLLERLKFLAIFESNLDEFYMVRVSGLIEQYEGGVSELSADGMTALEQLELVSQIAFPLRQHADKTWETLVRPALEDRGVTLLRKEDWYDKDMPDLDAYFQSEVFPLCTPLILDPAPSVPFISNRSLNIAVVLQDEVSGTRLARIKVPTVVKRTIRTSRRKHEYVLVEDLIQKNLHQFFPGVSILGAYIFRVIRDADVEILELEAGDLIESVEETLRLRRFGDPVLLEVGADMPKDVKRTLMRLLKLEDSDVFTIDGMIGLDALMELSGIDKPNLKFAPHVSHVHENLAHSESLFKAIQAQNVLTHQPYDSFKAVEVFIASAAKDPNVIGIKQTLYRVGAHSPVVESLLEAAEAGKQVAVMVELKARFDESNNLVWALALERAGAHVSYGFPELKTHCKLCLVVRREKGSIQTYAHIGTGNYNPSTARLYTDFGLFTKDPEITQDVAELFNFLTGYSRQTSFRKLLVAPINMREEVLKKIKRESDYASRGIPGRIIIKMNSLVDPQTIEALYSASNQGVKIDLIIRGICCLRPGVPGLSENISVRSIVGRFLEHSRVLYFANGEHPEVYLGSADLMRRNLDRRVEVLCPVEDPDHILYFRDEFFPKYLNDTSNSWILDRDGVYHRLAHGTTSAQRGFIDSPTSEVLSD